MAEVNKAYEEGDVERLITILRDWATSPEAIEGEDIGSKLVRTIRMNDRIKRRMTQIEKEIKDLMRPDLYELKLKVEEAEKGGRDLIGEMAAQLDTEITLAQLRCEEIRADQP